MCRIWYQPEKCRRSTIEQMGLYFKMSGNYFGIKTLQQKYDYPSQCIKNILLRGVSFNFISRGWLGSRNNSLYKSYPHLCYRDYFLTVAGVLDFWLVILNILPVPAGKGEDKQNKGTKFHTAPTEIKCQVI